MKFPIVITLQRPVDGRGWVGVACFALTLIILWMIWADRALLHDDFFKVIATAIILTGWNNGPVGWAYQATKSGGELAERNAGLVEEAARANPPIQGGTAKE